MPQRGAPRRTCERVVSAQAVRAGSVFVVRARARHLLLPIAHVRNQAISLTRRNCSTSTRDIVLTLLDVGI
jgi:hypothetical protein